MTTQRDEGGLAMLHGRLEKHFIQLSTARAAAAPGMPVFALEHALTEAELALLRAEVLKSVSRFVLPRKTWLPFVVYAAEIGYEFSGDEYWQTFAARTPGWTDLGDSARQFIRNRFEGFRDKFSGAEPSGRWAEHFSIICWPITHAVLPTDLQRHLARLLFDFRRSLTVGTLDDPDELGRRLAARAWYASARFQTFAENTRLLGQVAAALLTGEDEESPYLLPTTLTRILEDLSKERQAKRWMQDAKHTAHHVRRRGFQQSGGGAQSADGSRREFVASTDPSLFLRESHDGWWLYIELPDLSALSERLPIMTDELARLRPEISGVTRRFAAGHLLYPGQKVKVHRWPRHDDPLIQLENGSDVVNEHLADQCIMSPGPRWLFRIREPSFATEVRGKFVRPGHEYLLASEISYDVDLPAWVSSTRSATEGVYMYRLNPPARFDDADLSVIAELGLADVTNAEVRPVGYVPALWDGEGTVEWLEGEDPLVAVSSSRSVAQCILTLGDSPAVADWPEDSNEIVVRLADIEPGTHTLHVALIPPEADEPVVEGSLNVVVRPPLIRPASGTPREGIMILASPARPSLEELWDHQGFLEIVGPPGHRANVTLELTDRPGRVLAKQSRTLALRVDRARWADFFTRQFQQVERVHKKYDQAEACVVTVTTPGMGSASLRCERSFTPLRWAFGRDRDGPYVTLVDNTGRSDITIAHFDFSDPGEGETLSLALGDKLRRPQGGLLLATDGQLRASVVLPPLVRTLEDLRMHAPELRRLVRSKTEVPRAIAIAELWASASLPADPFGAARRLKVLRSIATALASIIGGQHWAKAEKASGPMGGIDLRMLSDAIGKRPHQTRLADALRMAISTMKIIDVPARVEHLAGIIHEHAEADGVGQGNDVVVSEFVLRLATEPSTLGRWRPSDFEDLLAITLSAPVLLRAARFVVLATAATLDEDTSSVYAGWAWQ